MCVCVCVCVCAQICTYVCVCECAHLFVVLSPVADFREIEAHFRAAQERAGCGIASAETKKRGLHVCMPARHTLHNMQYVHVCTHACILVLTLVEG